MNAVLKTDAQSISPDDPTWSCDFSFLSAANAGQVLTDPRAKLPCHSKRFLHLSWGVVHGGSVTLLVVALVCIADSFPNIRVYPIPCIPSEGFVKDRKKIHSFMYSFIFSLYFLRHCIFFEMFPYYHCHRLFFIEIICIVPYTKCKKIHMIVCQSKISMLYKQW